MNTSTYYSDFKAACDFFFFNRIFLGGTWSQKNLRMAVIIFNKCHYFSSIGSKKVTSNKKWRSEPWVDGMQR